MQKKPAYIPVIYTALVILIMTGGCKTNNGIPYNDGNVEQNIISIKRARSYTANYRQGHTELMRLLKDSTYLKNKFQLPIAVQFNRDVLALLLNQKDSTGAYAKGIRMYFARNEKSEITLVLVPYDGKNNDMLKRLINKDVASIPGISSANAADVEAQAVDNSLRCPTLCDNSNSGLGLQ